MNCLLESRVDFCFLIVVSHYVCFYSDHPVYVTKKIILAWMALSCYSSLVLNVPSSEKHTLGALIWCGPSHSPPHHPSLLLWHLAVSGLFLLCSSVPFLEMITRFLQCHTPSTGTISSRLVAQMNEQKECQSFGFHPPGALECHTRSPGAMFNMLPSLTDFICLLTLDKAP